MTNIVNNVFQGAMYFIQLMDQIVTQPYVVVYLHTDTQKHNQPDVAFIKDIYNLVDQRSEYTFISVISMRRVSKFVTCTNHTYRNFHYYFISLICTILWSF